MHKISHILIIFWHLSFPLKCLFHFLSSFNQSIYGTSKPRRRLDSFATALRLFSPSASLLNPLIVRRFLFTWSFQRSRGLPKGLLPLSVLFATWKTRLVFSRRKTCPNQRTLLLFERATISESLYLSLSSLSYSYKILQVLFSWMGPKIIPKILFSNVCSAFTNFFDKIQVFEQYRRMVKW